MTFEYMIRNVNNPDLYFSADYGWTDEFHADMFSGEEAIELPVNGMWVEVTFEVIPVNSLKDI